MQRLMREERNPAQLQRAVPVKPKDPFKTHILEALLSSVKSKVGNEVSNNDLIESVELEFIMHEPLLESLLMIFLESKDRVTRNNDQTFSKDMKTLLSCKLMPLLSELTLLRNPS